MGNFRTEDDFDDYRNEWNKPTDFPDYGGYDNPEFGSGPGDYGRIQKSGIFSKLFESLGNAGTGLGSKSKRGLTPGKILLLVYLIAMVIIIINIGAVLDFLFYTTMALMQHVILVLVVLVLGYILFRFILR